MLDYLDRIDGSDYAGFNLLVGDGRDLGWLSNRGDGPALLEAGIYGLSNALLDAPWHKVLRSKDRLKRILETGDINETELLRLLSDRDRAPAGDVESDRLPFETAHAVSAPFVVHPDYGTRCSSVAIRTAEQAWRFHERRFDADGKAAGDSRFRFDRERQE